MAQAAEQITDTQRVLFGTGLRKTVASELRRLGAAKAMVLTTPQQNSSALEMAELLGPLASGLFCKARMHTPVEVTEAAISHLKESGADSLVALGGGSTIGLAKAIALRTGLPQIVIPTTYAGSEATPILGQTENGVKTTLRDPTILPDVVLYDAELVATLPLEMTVTSALNAMAHAAEALYAADRTGESTALAIEGLRAFVHGVPDLIANPHDLAAREASQRGAWACGAVLGRVGMALHHKLCHSLGGAFDLPHAETHSVILPHAIAYNAKAAPDQLRPICDLLGGSNPGQALYEFALSLKAPMSLRALGLKEEDLDRAAELACQTPYPNPRPVTEHDIRALLQAAWDGTAPQS